MVRVVERDGVRRVVSDWRVGSAGQVPEFVERPDWRLEVTTASQRAERMAICSACPEFGKSPCKPCQCRSRVKRASATCVKPEPLWVAVSMNGNRIED